MTTPIRKLTVFLARNESEPNYPANTSVEYENARFWDGRFRQNVPAVYAPSFPKIEEVYRASGRIVYREADYGFGEGGQEAPIEQASKGVDEESYQPTQAPDEPVDDTPNEPEQSAEGEQESPTEAPDEPKQDWRDLSWPKMRSFAKGFTDEPIKSKDEAIRILECAEGAGEI